MTAAAREAETRPDRRPARRLKHLAGRAIHEYALIAEGDVVAVGVSGGKDSLVLTAFLADLRRRAPVRFGLGAFHLEPADQEGALRPWLEGLDLDFIHREPAPLVAELAEYRPGGPSPCFPCARARRNRLFELAREYRVNRLALGHHLDDAVETLLLNIFYSGRLEGLAARQDLFEGRLSIIRPLFLVPEELVVRLASDQALPVLPKTCPADGRTRRQEVKELVADMTRRNPKVFGNLTASVMAASPRLPGRPAADAR